jgi:hypothetical protein
MHFIVLPVGSLAVGQSQPPLVRQGEDMLQPLYVGDCFFRIHEFPVFYADGGGLAFGRPRFFILNALPCRAGVALLYSCLFLHHN